MSGSPSPTRRLENFGRTAASPASHSLATDGDGVANLLKYAFNLERGKPAGILVAGESTAGLPDIRIYPTTSSLCVEYVRRRADTVPGIVCHVEFSTDLTNWSIPSNAVEEVEEIDGIRQRVRLHDPPPPPRPVRPASAACGSRKSRRSIRSPPLPHPAEPDRAGETGRQPRRAVTRTAGVSGEQPADENLGSRPRAGGFFVTLRPMRLRRLTLQNLRNIAFAEFLFAGRQQFFVGQNGQGKTNLLEAVGFVTALRSFRAADTGLLIAHGKREGALAAEFEHEKFGPSRVMIALRSGGKEVTCDGERVTRLADFLGRFPTVVFSSQDQQLARGAPALRRRWLDLALAGVDAGYLYSLTNYHRALDARNQLLKRQAPAAELAAFEAPLAEAAAALVLARRAGVAALAPQVAAAYAALSADAETATLAYEANTDAGEAAAWRAHFEKSRPRDLLFRGSQSGPHRDDLEFRIGGRAARDYGSEGQQRSLVLALRLAQVGHVRAATGVQPVLLADDVLGELDPERRRRFWAALGEERQVLATGTELPYAGLGAWEVFRVAGGAFTAEGTV